MEKQSYKRVLVTGPPGAGKTTLVERALDLGLRGIWVDIDWLGAHLPVEGGRTKWLVKSHTVEVLFQAPCDVWVFGMSSNMFRTVDYVQKVEDLGVTVKQAKPIAYSLPWTDRVQLVWDPTDEEYLARFGEGRANRYGKTEPSKSRVLAQALSSYFGPAPRGFVNVDTTGVRDVDKALDLVLDAVFGTSSVGQADDQVTETDSSKREKSAVNGPTESLQEEGVKNGSKGSDYIAMTIHGSSDPVEWRRSL